MIPNGVDTTRFRPNPAVRLKMREQLGLGQEFVWLAAGRLMWKKGYETMLRAWARLDGGVLLIAGAGPQESELRGLGSGARFLGEREDVADLMAAADGFVQSSLVEGLPVALLEAASSGLPCVAADTGGVSEIVLHERTGYLVPAGRCRLPGGGHVANDEPRFRGTAADGRRGPRTRERAVRSGRSSIALGGALPGAA